MTDLNLDGLPNLLTLQMHADSWCEASSRLLRELRQLVERERVRAVAEAEDRELSAAAEELPVWAKPVMRAVRELACSEPLSDEEDECCDKVRELGETLTEAQLKEIGEDDG